MPEYRVYFLDAGNHITGRLEVVAENDRLVIAEMAAKQPNAAYEIWQGERLFQSPGGSNLDKAADDSGRALRRTES